MIAGMAVPPDLQVVLFAHASRDAIFMNAMQAGGLNEGTTVLGRIACTCRAWARLARSDELWRSVLYEQIGSSTWPTGDAEQSPLCTQMKALCVLKILAACTRQYVDISSQNSHRLVSLKMLLQQLDLCEALLIFITDSTLRFNIAISSWVSKNLIANGTSSWGDLQKRSKELLCSNAPPDSQEIQAEAIVPVLAAELLQPVLVDVGHMKASLKSKIKGSGAAYAEANMSRIFGKKKWPKDFKLWFEEKYGV